MAKSRNSSVENYIAQLFVAESEESQKIKQALEADSKLGINMSAAEAGILQFLIGLIGAKVVVEIGLLYGYTALFMAEALPEDGKLYSLEKSEENFERARQLLSASSHFHKIELLKGDARESLLKLGDIQVDLIFIDADKAGYSHYLTWAEKHVRVGGLIVGDNTLLWGGVFGEPQQKSSDAAIASMKEFNLRLANNKNFRSILLPTPEGLTVAQRIR